MNLWMIEYLLSSTEESRFREVKTRLPYLISLQFSGETESSMFRALFLSQLVQAHCHFWHTVFLGKDFITATWMNTHYTLRMCSLNTWVFLSLNDGLTNKFSTLEIWPFQPNVLSFITDSAYFCLLNFEFRLKKSIDFPLEKCMKWRELSLVSSEI